MKKEIVFGYAYINASLKNLIKARGGENFMNKAWWFILAFFMPI